MSRTEIRLSGFGGQGIILAGNIVGQAAAIYDGRHATFTQAYGPEARGGACSAQVVISDEPGGYPYIENPAVVVAMSPEAYTKYAANVGDDITVIIDDGLVKPNKSQESRILKVPATRIAEELGRSAVANIVMLGFLASVIDTVSVDALKKSVLDSVPKGTEELNMKAFERGYAHGKEQMKGR
ncbi:MAG: 2-oxoacid:acceptor oxidoreductase family protein [Dehalococcoidia bacterium]|nr:2-oxoacid:acceptor oxidoreductase family protein [Dehalococcoidia bacterium]